MCQRRLGLGVIFSLVVGVASGSLAADEKAAASLRQRHLAQQQARGLATELASHILDVQLRQFEENKLDKLPAYADIAMMRRNLDRLVDQEMQAVVKLFEKAEDASEADRQAVIAEARSKGRAVVVALLAEQQRLRQRMRLAKIAAQARQLIDLESRVLVETQQLPEKQPSEREQATLEQVENQRDIAVLHAQLLLTLQEVSKWEGSVAAAATKGLDLLTKMQVDQELKNADAALNASRLADAEKAEDAAIKGWKALLEVIEQAQGLMQSERDSLAKDLESLIQQQSKLRDETKASNLDEARSEKLAEQQHAVNEQLNQLMEKLPQDPSAESLAKQAAEAAAEAETNLFEGKQEPAVQQQGQVMEALSEVTKKLDQENQLASKPSSQQLANKDQQAEKPSPTNDPAASQESQQAEAGQSAKAKKSDLAKQSAQKKAGEPSEEQMQNSGDAIPTGKQSQMSTQSGSAGESAPRSVATEPWFAKLPPTVQKSIQAQSRRSPPRGYEERLKRYFESD
jgi:hypothetical protein